MTTLSLTWGVAHRSLNDAAESGDLCVIQPFPGGTLIAVLDGAGHGREAGTAVNTAAKILASYAKEPPISLLRRCHDALRSTRGAALSVASIRTSECLMTWLGVGNVEGILVRGDPTVRPRSESLVLRAGVVGRQLPPLAGVVLPLEAGDSLVFSTDGVGHGFTKLISPGVSPQHTANLILARHGKKSDDALVVVACCKEHEA